MLWEVHPHGLVLMEILSQQDLRAAVWIAPANGVRSKAQKELLLVTHRHPWATDYMSSACPLGWPLFSRGDFCRSTFMCSISNSLILQLCTRHLPMKADGETVLVGRVRCRALDNSLLDLGLA